MHSTLSGRVHASSRVYRDPLSLLDTLPLASAALEETVALRALAVDGHALEETAMLRALAVVEYAIEETAALTMRRCH